MAKFKVYVYEVHQVEVEVEADTSEAAKRKVERREYNSLTAEKKRFYSHRLDLNTWMAFQTK